jgi:NADH-quinone oxidoreductase subunit I
VEATMAVKLVDRPGAEFEIQSYLPEVWKGMKVAGRHFFVNLLTHREIATTQYPEQQRAFAPRYRGKHRLMRREDGQVRCVACFMCSTACPADCIRIVAGEHEDRGIEKFPVVFEIDMLTCIFCGMCEEACPCDAIRLDTGVQREPAQSRADEFAGKVDLMKLTALSVSTQGGEYK